MSSIAILLTIAILQGSVALGLALGVAMDLRRRGPFWKPIPGIDQGDIDYFGREHG